MRKALAIASILVLVAAGVALAGVGGTPHDLRGTSAVNNSQEVCAACHTPHGAVSSANGPLWNRSQAAQSYTFYSSSTFDMTVNGLGPKSLACLTCHNGVTSSLVNAPGPGSGAGVTWQMTNPSNNEAIIGTDLSNDHPVGFTYDPNADLNNNGFPAVNQATNEIGTTGLYVFDENVGNDQMECATCHDVHDTVTYAGKGNTTVHFLRMSNAGSAMCAACHTNRY